MRIHRLEITAFGPFAGHETVDFDALGAQGLFLLNGPTGAGKTSVLDAVAYALYGQIPGARKDSIKNLHSHHAAPELAPEVVCEFSAGGRRLEVRRSPEWQRPAKRGGGTTKAQAATCLRERVDGEWVPVSQRNDEASVEITGLLGMTMEQFTKVILLAQGEFAAFLRAGAKDREELLEKLFGTQVYQGLEQRLAEDAREARDAVAAGTAKLDAQEESARQQAAGVLAAAGLLAAEGDGDEASGKGGDGSEPADTDSDGSDSDGSEPAGAEASDAGAADTGSDGQAPSGADLPGAAPGVEPGITSVGAELFDWLTASLIKAVALAAEQSLANEAAGADAEQAFADAQACRERHTLRDAALAEQDRLAAAADEAQGWRGRLRLHRDAQLLASVVNAEAKAAASLSVAELSVVNAGAAFAANDLAMAVAAASVDGSETGDACGETSGAGDAGAENAGSRETGSGGAAATGAALPDAVALAAVERALAAQGAEVDAALPGEQRLAAAAAKLKAGTAALAAATAEVAEQQAAETSGKARLTAATEELAALREDAVPVGQARDAHAAARALSEAIKLHAARQAEVDELAVADLAAREDAATARGTWLDAVELRLSLAAGELAATLVDGEPCQVCGSTVHPNPSGQAGSGAEAVAAEKKAKAAHAAAEAEAVKRRSALEAAQRELAVLAGRGGDGDAEAARAALERTQGDLDAAAAAAERQKVLDAETGKAQAAVEAAQAALLAATGQVAALTAGHDALAQEAAALECGLDQARAGHPTLAARKSAIAAAQQRAAALAAALREADAAAKAQATAAAELAVALEGSAFADAAQVQAALLSESVEASLAKDVEDREKALTLNKAQLERAEVAAAALEAERGVGAPGEEELAALRGEAVARRTAARDADVRLEVARTALASIERTADGFARLEAEVGPLRERAALLTGLSEAVRGGSGNELKMTLTSYVLAARLEQVADAASVRLATMSGGRYTLSHTDAKAGRNRKSGLGLEVVDEWTQQGRDTATLSGGESFMASLSLALGLADVVQQESGGLDIETLFVDEGFGSLDEESLEQVMDALEGLRDGGRVVGLVSHVAEMKTRIPVHLQVAKGRHGSTLALDGV